MRTYRRLLSALMAIAVFAACSDEGPVSGPGTLTASLVGPNGAEGAALVVVSGEGIGEITAVGDTEVFSEAEPGRSRLVLINQVGGDLIFRVAVADTTVLPTFLVEQVAGPDDALRVDLASYSVEFER